jgi:predicted alpha/beta-fold hydrolase
LAGVLLHRQFFKTKLPARAIFIWNWPALTLYYSLRRRSTNASSYSKFLNAKISMLATNTLPDFRPALWAPGGHLQTIIGYYLPWPKQLNDTQLHTVKLDRGDALIFCENRPNENRPLSGAVLLMHGLGGSAQSPYMLRAARLFREHGWVALRMNHRGCGEGRGLARQLYHSGRSDDISQALIETAKRHPNLPVVAVGFSLSGNALLKLLGEKIHPIPTNLRGAVAVCPPIDLALCAAALARKNNWIYERRFVRMVKTSIREREQDFPDFPKFDFPWNLTLRQFDEMRTAPMNGFASADDYYAKCSAKQFLAAISHPALLLACDNDPFIPRETFRDLPGNKFLQMRMTRSGGHMGFVAAQNTPLGKRNWLDYAVLSYAQKVIEPQ